MWDQKRLICVFFGVNVEKTIFIFKMSNLEFFRMLKFVQSKTKTSNLRPKMS